MKKCFTSLLIRGIKINTQQYHLTSVRMAHVKIIGSSVNKVVKELYMIVGNTNRENNTKNF